MKIKILIVVWLLSAAAIAQIIPVHNCIGECTLANITPEAAKLHALEDAKIAALQKAGIEQTISVNITFDALRDVFNQFSTTEIRGGIVNYTVTLDTIVHVLGTPMVRVVIDAKVKKYRQRSDPQFKIKIDGLRSHYKNGEIVTFTVTPFQEGFLKIFLLEDDNKVSLVYPNERETVRLFGKGETITFPTESTIEYIATKAGTEQEHNYWVFVYTRQNIPFVQEVTYQNVLNWIYAIEPNNRTVEFMDLMLY